MGETSMNPVCVDREDLKAMVNEIIRLRVSQRAQTSILSTQQSVNREGTHRFVEALRERKRKVYDSVRLEAIEILGALDKDEQICEALRRFIEHERDDQDRRTHSGKSLYF